MPQVPPNASDLCGFEPSAGTLVRMPPGTGNGYWAGAPGVYYDHAEDRILLLYRLRRPRGVPPDRGGEVRLATSRNGVDFEDLWTLHKDVLDTPSIERCALTRSPDGDFLLYLSYVDPADQRWRIDVVKAPTVARFDFAKRQSVLTASRIAAEGVKDPWLVQRDGLYWMVVSFATTDATVDAAQLHATADAYNTGLIRSRSGLATSIDGLRFDWQGEILGPSENGWDRYAARISCLWHQPPVWLAFYDGSADVGENYEERCGLAQGTDLRNLLRVTPDGPLLTITAASGSVRYLDVLPLVPGSAHAAPHPDAAALCYYEMARADGSHALYVHPIRDAKLSWADG